MVDHRGNRKSNSSGGRNKELPLQAKPDVLERISKSPGSSTVRRKAVGIVHAKTTIPRGLSSASNEPPLREAEVKRALDGAENPEIGQQTTENGRLSGRQPEEIENGLERKEHRDSQIGAWITGSMRNEMKRAAASDAIHLEEWMIRAFSEKLGREDIPSLPKKSSAATLVEHAGLSTSGRVKKVNAGLRLEPKLLEAVKSAIEESGIARNDWLRAAVVQALEEGLDAYEVLEGQADVDP